MDLTFDKGDSQAPKGHAVIYFRVNTEPDKVYATYVITLPIKADLGKYVPPFLSAHLGNLPLNDLSAFAMPPVPEPVDSYEELERLCDRRGPMTWSLPPACSPSTLPRMMESITEAVSAYSELCNERFGQEAPSTGELEQPGDPVSEEDRAFAVNEVLFSLMSESDKLAELAKLLGSLRFAVEGGDSSTVTRSRKRSIRWPATYRRSSVFPPCLRLPRTRPKRDRDWPSFTWTGASGCQPGITPASRTWRTRYGPWKPRNSEGALFSLIIPSPARLVLSAQ